MKSARTDHINSIPLQNIEIHTFDKTLSLNFLSKNLVHMNCNSIEHTWSFVVQLEILNSGNNSRTYLFMRCSRPEMPIAVAIRMKSFALQNK